MILTPLKYPFIFHKRPGPERDNSHARNMKSCVTGLYKDISNGHKEYPDSESVVSYWI